MVARQYLWGGEANMVLYYAILRAWLATTGALGIAASEIVLRLPSAIFGIATAILVYLLGRRLFGRVAGLVAGLVYLTSFLQIILAQMARAYTLQLLLLTVAGYVLFRGLESGARRRWWALFVASSALAVYAQLFSGLVLASLFAGVVAMAVLPGPWSERVRASRSALGLSALAIAVLISPIAIDAAVHGGPVWVPPAHLHDIRTFVRGFLSGGSRRYELVIFAVMTAALLLAVLSRGRPRVARISRIDPSMLAPAIAIAFWFAGPLVLSFALTQPRLNLHLFFPRYLGVVVPPLALLVGLGVTGLRWRVAQAALAALVCLVAVPALLTYYQYAQVQDFRTVSRWVESRYQRGDGVICSPAIECGIPVDYYFVSSGGPARFDDGSPGRFVWDGVRSIPLSDGGVQAYAARHSRVFVIYGPLGPSPAHLAELERLKADLVGLFHLTDQVTAPGSAVELSAYLYQAGP